MAQLYLIPNWFFGYDIFLEVLFGIITFFVASYALKIYSVSKEREFGLLGVSFMLISLSYFIWSIINFVFVKQLNETTRILILPEISVISVFWLYSHIMLFMVGLITLFYMTCKTRSDKLYSLLVVASLFLILFSSNKSLVIHLYSSVILSYITIHYGIEYNKNKNKGTKSIFISFLLLLIANFLLIYAGNMNSQYVLAHLLQLGSFGIILWNLVKITKNGRQKKK